MKKILFILLILLNTQSLFAKMRENSIVLTSQGVEGISSSTRFKKAMIKRIFPKFKVVESSRSSEGKSQKVIEVKKRGKLFLVIYPKKRDHFRVGRVDIINSDIDNRFDFDIGDRYRNIFIHKKIKCFIGVEENSEKVYCKDPKYKNFLFEFSGKNSNGDGTLPPKGVLRNFKLTKIIWNLEE